MFKIFKYTKSKALIYAILSIILIIGGCVCDLYQPTLLNDVIEQTAPLMLKTGGSWDKFWMYCWIILGLAIVGVFSTVAGMFAAAKASLLTTQYIRSDIYKNILRFSFADIDKFSTGSLITRLTNDCVKFQMLDQLSLTILLRAPVMFIGGLCLSFTDLEWQFGLIAVGLSILLLIIVGLCGKNTFKYFSRAQKGIDNTNAVMRENVLGMRVVKSFGIQDEQLTRFRKASSSYKKYKIKGESLIAPIMPAVTTLLQLGIFLGLLVSGILADSDPEVVGRVFSFTNLLMIVLSSIIMACMVFVQLMVSKPSIYRILKVLDTKPSIVESENPKAIPKDLSISFKHVNYKYSDTAKKDILKNINCEIKPGQLIGITGGTGSGKSTFVNLIPRLYDTKHGSITLGNVDVKDLSFDDLRKNIAVVLQENNLFQGTIKQNLLYGNQKATDKELIQACEAAGAWDFVKNFKGKLDYPVEQRGRNFSGGQKQRLCIARALVRKPKILIMDDSTSALDLITEAKILNSIKSQYKDSTIIVVSQRVASMKNADNIFVFENGRIAQQGTHKQLASKQGIYKTIVMSQLGKEGLR